MPIPFALQNMTIEEKLRAMEFLWDDLCARAESMPSPDWHAELLSEWKAAIARGEEHFEDWQTARQNIEKNIQ